MSKPHAKSRVLVVQGKDATAIVKMGKKKDPQPHVVVKYRGVGSRDKTKKRVS